MAISKIGLLLLFFLAASASLGGAILVVDNVLWTYAPTHAYGLIGFTAIDLLLIILIFFTKKKGLLLAGLWGVVQLAILTGNLFFGAQIGVTNFKQEELRDYFLGIAVAQGASPGFGFYKISPYAYDVLLSMQALLAVTGLLAYRRAGHVPATS